MFIFIITITIIIIIIIIITAGDKKILLISRARS